MTHSLRYLLKAATVRLREAGVVGPGTDARLLLQHAAGLDHARLIADPGLEMESRNARRFDIMIERRIAGEPVSRIIGEREFYGSRFEIDKNVLDPRPETEMLVDAALQDFGKGDGVFFCDVGTGSGAIGISLLNKMPLARCIAVDISDAALAAARRNAKRHGVSDRLECVCSDYLDGVAGPFDFIVANPPYVCSRDLDSLAREVRLHDPELALDGGPDGLTAYRRILEQARGRLIAGGRLYLEIGAGQEEACREIAESGNWKLGATLRDIAGITRIMVFDPVADSDQDDQVTKLIRKSLESDAEQASFHVVQG